MPQLDIMELVRLACGLCYEEQGLFMVCQDRRYFLKLLPQIRPLR